MLLQIEQPQVLSTGIYTEIVSKKFLVYTVAFKIASIKYVFEKTTSH